jgi:predicted acyltransferase (DUF342 family)
MKDHIITKADLDSENCYCANVELVGFQGNIKLCKGLGEVRFKNIDIKGSLIAATGTSIYVVNDLSADNFIHVEESITTGGSIHAGLFVKAGVRLRAEGDISAVLDVRADWGVFAGGNIKAGSDVTSRSGVQAGGCIEVGASVASGSDILAGDCIRAGLTIRAYRNLTAGGTAIAGKNFYVGGQLRTETKLDTALVG